LLFTIVSIGGIHKRFTVEREKLSEYLDQHRMALPLDWPSLEFIDKINPGSTDAHFYSIQYSYLCYIALYQFAASFCKDQKVLDAASGLGFGSYLLSEIATDVTGIEIMVKDITFAKENYDRENLSFIHGDATSTVFPKNYFSRIVSLETFEHVPPEKAMFFLEELQSVLIPGGLFIFSTPNRDVYSKISNTPDHVNELNVDEMKSMLMQVFPNVQSYYQRKGALQTTGTYYSAVRNDKLGIRKLAPAWLKSKIRKVAAPNLVKSSQDILNQVRVHKADSLSDVRDSVIQLWVCQK
jgi:2-polyprenyl-3-methyl-5-hydroxy-6-metoxy-1,4-benzoquinol methylase